MIEGAFKSIRETHIKPRPVTPRSDSLIFSRQVAGQLHLLSTLESLVIKISNSWWTNICKVCVPSTVPCVPLSFIRIALRIWIYYGNWRLIADRTLQNPFTCRPTGSLCMRIVSRRIERNEKRAEIDVGASVV